MDDTRLMAAFSFAAVIINGPLPVPAWTDPELTVAVMRGRKVALTEIVAERLHNPQRYGADNNVYIASYLTAWGF